MIGEAYCVRVGELMATIVTVHGTFASGPMEGTKWWQLGSRLCRNLPVWIEGADGSLRIEPYIWNGHNSESSRRTAGKGLADKLAELEAVGEPYAVIGHSHGGSVISAALLNAARARNELRHMQLWVTVGTPFIRTERQRFLFSRLGLFGKAIYLTLLTFAFLVALSVFVGAEQREWPQWIIAFVTSVGPLALFYGLLRVQESRRSLRFNRKFIDFAAKHFADRWLSLWHAKDEAVQSLKAIKSLDVAIFSRDFAASTFNLLAIAVIPFICILVLTSEPFMDAVSAQVFSIIDEVAADELYSAGGHNIFENAAVLLIGLLIIPASYFLPAGAFNNMSDAATFGLLAFSLALLIGAALCLTWLFNFLARFASHGLSLVLNPLTLTQLKAVAYGSDAQEDLAVDAAEWPVWLTRRYPPLPADIGDELELASNNAIATAIPKFRNIVDNFTSAETAQETSDILADYLSWNELIHTSYFEQDRFTMLLAYAISQSEGFRASEVFASHPEYSGIAQDYAGISNHVIVGPVGA